jgi:hypothetical protein
MHDEAVLFAGACGSSVGMLGQAGNALGRACVLDHGKEHTADRGGCRV